MDVAHACKAMGMQIGKCVCAHMCKAQIDACEHAAKVA